MQAIIISGMPASGKTTVAEIVADALKVECIGGGDMLKELAREQGYKPSGAEWWDTQIAMRFLEQRQRDPDFDKKVDRILLERIAKGDVVATSWTAPWISKLGFKVWLSASAETRATRMAQRDSSSYAKSLEAVRARDSENYKLFKKLYSFELGIDLSPFDMVIDVDNIGPEAIALLIIESARKHQKG